MPSLESFLPTMRERGLVAQVTHEDELRDHLKERRAAYIGFDPTAPSLHVGHLMQIMNLRRWQKAGGRVIAVVGGGTAMVGDPTGKTDMRQMLTVEKIRQNMVGLKEQLGKFIDFSTSDQALMVNNYDWLQPLNYLEFLRDIGPHFSVNRMLTAECFKQRLEKGLSFLEFNYMLLQSYDFLHLFKAEKCTLQMGGDDQWSNILAGMELIRRLGDGNKAFCLTTPLLTTSEGKKMGKTEKGAVWLDAGETPPYEYFQYWRNVEDAVVRMCLAAFTDLPMPEVNGLTADGADMNYAKLELALNCTRLLHGTPAADEAYNKICGVFPSSRSETLIKKYGINFVEDAGGEEMEIDRATLGDGLTVVDFVTVMAIAPSKGEARRLVQQGGLAINGEKVEDINYKVTKTAFQGASGCLVKKGKKSYYRIRISG